MCIPKQMRKTKKWPKVWNDYNNVQTNDGIQWHDDKID